MADHCYTFVGTSFKLFVLCILIWFIYQGIDRYIQDEDVSLISFKTFHDGSDYLYPTTTMCFYNPFLQEELKKYGSGINITSYSQYLQGKFLDERMKYVPYDNVTISMEDQLLSISGKLENSSFIWLFDHENKHQLHHSAKHPPYYTSFKSGLSKCFSFDIPYIPNTVIWSLFITIKTGVFPKGTRARNIYFDGTDATEGGFTTSFHYPKQLLRGFFNMKYQ